MQEQNEIPTPQPETKEVVTEVTSIAEEEKKTGQKINIPGPQELAAKASASLLMNRRLIAPIFGDLSKKATLRTLLAIFDVPQEGLPVKLVTKEEKQAYAIGRNMMYDIFLIMQHHIHQKRAEIAAEVAADQKELDKEIDKEESVSTESQTNPTQENANGQEV